MPELDDGGLRAFGELVDRLEQPCIDVGGFIDLGQNPPSSSAPRGGEVIYNGQGQREGQGQGQGQTETTSGEAPHTLDGRLRECLEVLSLDELYVYHPEARFTYSSLGPDATAALLNVPIGLFTRRSERARLTMEIPLSLPSFPARVNDVRVWARWGDGTLITSHHAYPDRSICPCLSPDWLRSMRGDWVRGLDPIHDYVAYCTLWVAKALHQRVYNTWPGLQHFPPAARLRRNKPDEYCGCGAPQRYVNCCLTRDRTRPLNLLVREEMQAQTEYMRRLEAEGRVPRPSYG